MQPLDTDGTLLRGTTYDSRPLPKGAIGGVVVIDAAPAGCVRSAADVTIGKTELRMLCGLIPGASGGGLFADHDGELTLVGITSTVTPDLLENGLVPIAAVHTLLSNPTRYTHEVPLVRSSRAVGNITRS